MWLTRWNDGWLYMYDKRPERYRNISYEPTGELEEIPLYDRSSFPEVTFEGGPVQVELKISDIKLTDNEES